MATRKKSSKKKLRRQAPTKTAPVKEKVPAKSSKPARRKVSKVSSKRKSPGKSPFAAKLTDGRGLKLVERVRQILDPHEQHLAEEIASVLIETVAQLKQRKVEVLDAPLARSALTAAHKKLSVFKEHWESHPEIHGYIPRDLIHLSYPISRLLGDMLQNFKTAIGKLPEKSRTRKPEEAIRDWISFAVVSTLKARKIQVSQYEKSKAVRLLDLACDLMGLPRISREKLSGHIRTGRQWTSRF